MSHTIDGVFEFVHVTGFSKICMKSVVHPRFWKGKKSTKNRATVNHVLFKHAHVLFKYFPKVYFSQHNADIMLSFEIRYTNFKQNCQKQWPWLLHMAHRNNYISLTIQMHLTQSSIVIHHQHSIFLNHLKHQKIFFFSESLKKLIVLDKW